MLTSVCVTSTASWAASSSLCSFPRQTMGAASALLDADSGLCGPGLYGGDFDVACMVEPTKMVELTSHDGGSNKHWWPHQQELAEYEKMSLEGGTEWWFFRCFDFHWRKLMAASWGQQMTGMTAYHRFGMTAYHRFGDLKLFDFYCHPPFFCLNQNLCW